MSQPTYLGRCCLCDKTRRVRTVVLLEVKGLVPGHGWGCLVCGLPSDGASAVLCDPCARKFAAGTPLKFACRGYPATEGRVPIGELTVPHEHDYRRHPEIRSCRVCGCVEWKACRDPVTGEPCHWVEEDLCSACANKPVSTAEARGA